MPATEHRARKTSTRLYLLGLLLLTLASAFYALRGYEDQTRLWFSSDFKPVYGGAACLLAHCNPYDSDQIRQQYLLKGGDAAQVVSFHANYANYPPSALFLALPFALFHWPTAHILWLGCSAAIFLLAAFLVADLCRLSSPFLAVACLSTLVFSSTMLMMLAQPAAMVIGLCVIAVWTLIRQRFVALGILCFALSLSIKPHLSGPVWLYFALAGSLYRRRALQIFAVTLACCLPGFLWASVMPQSSHWLHDLRTNLVAVAEPGELSDPGPRNLQRDSIVSFQTVFSNIHDDPHFYNRMTYASIGGLMLVWAWLVLRTPPSTRRDLLALASIACLSLLLIYHRQYDTRLIMLVVPALGLLLAEGFGPRAGAAAGKPTALTALALTFLTFVTTSHNFDHLLVRLYTPHRAALGTVARTCVEQHIPLTLLVLGCFYLACLARPQPNTATPITI